MEDETLDEKQQAVLNACSNLIAMMSPRTLAGFCADYEQDEYGEISILSYTLAKDQLIAIVGTDEAEAMILTAYL